jgi:hypothetical protein
LPPAATPRQLSRAGCTGAGTSGLDARFDRRLCLYAPYFFADLSDPTEADEQAAIDAGQIQATGIRYVGRRRRVAPTPVGAVALLEQGSIWSSSSTVRVIPPPVSGTGAIA